MAIKLPARVRISTIADPPFCFCDNCSIAHRVVKTHRFWNNPVLYPIPIGSTAVTVLFPDFPGKNRFYHEKVRLHAPAATRSDVVLPIYTKTYAHCPQAFPQAFSFQIPKELGLFRIIPRVSTLFDILIQLLMYIHAVYFIHPKQDAKNAGVHIHSCILIYSVSPRMDLVA